MIDDAYKHKIRTAAEIAEVNGDDASATLYLAVADEFRRKVVDWTFTTTGPSSVSNW